MTTTREIIEYLQSYERIHGITVVKNISMMQGEKTNGIGFTFDMEETAANALTVDTLARGYYLDKLKYHIIEEAVRINVSTSSTQVYQNYTARGRMQANIRVAKEMGHKVEVKERLRDGNYQVESIKIDGIPLYEKSEEK